MADGGMSRRDSPTLSALLPYAVDAPAMAGHQYSKNTHLAYNKANELAGSLAFSLFVSIYIPSLYHSLSRCIEQNKKAASAGGLLAAFSL